MLRSIGFLMILGCAAPLAAQTGVGGSEPIIVTGNRVNQGEISADLAKAITLRPPKGSPLARHYDPVCIKIFGLPAEYADVMAERFYATVKTLNILAGNAGCHPNSWIGFVKNSKEAVTQLRKSDPAMFAELHPYEIDRILAGSNAAHAWHAVQKKGADGKEFTQVLIRVGDKEGIERSVSVNDQWQAGRIIPAIRADMVGSIVLFDGKLVAGRSIRQLADYASFRLLAPVKDLTLEQAEQSSSILSLFTDGAKPPLGLTEFDWSYLLGYYKLGIGAGANAMHDAAKSAFLNEKGLQAVAASDAPVPE